MRDALWRQGSRYAAAGAVLVIAVAAVVTMGTANSQGGTGDSAATPVTLAARRRIGGAHAQGGSAAGSPQDLLLLKRGQLAGPDRELDLDIDGAASRLEGWLFAAAHRAGAWGSQHSPTHAAHVAHVNHHKVQTGLRTQAQKAGATQRRLPSRPASLDSQASTVLQWLGLSHLSHHHRRHHRSKKQVSLGRAKAVKAQSQSLVSFSRTAALGCRHCRAMPPAARRPVQVLPSRLPMATASSTQVRQVALRI